MATSTNNYVLQSWLIEQGQAIDLDGMAGQATRDAIMAAFVNLQAPAITAGQERVIAERLGVSLAQLRSVASVESSGGGFDNSGRPKILYERHIFDRITGGAFSVTDWSNPSGGGYDQSSWTKLCAAACTDFWAAFSSCSWGKFQVMGMHWQALDYPTPQDMAHIATRGELEHYDMLARFISVNKLDDEMGAISNNPDDCRPFAKGYNGSNYAAGNYHVKLADAHKRETA